MKSVSVLFLLAIAAISACNSSRQNNDSKELFTALSDSAQAISLMGDTLYPSSPYANGSSKYDTAKMNYQASPDNVDNIIWYGRWTAYKGDFREAIRIYTEGISKFPQDARLYRHRGHRYISIREFDRAIADFEKAASLIEGKKDEIEPDGQPNAFNIPIGSLHSNIWYHLGLAYYLKNDLAKALPVYERAVRESNNDDKLTSTTHWLYMTLRLLGKKEEAEKILEPIQPAMNIIENKAYHQLCLLYKGLLPADSLTGETGSASSNDAVAYGVANWYYYNGNHEKAKALYEQILKGKIWASFGYIAAEADYVRRFRK
jgi:tetratricopeptide (TPR) repeat protein